MQVLYEDNHIIIVNKAASEIVQGDKTGDLPLSEMVVMLLAQYSKSCFILKRQKLSHSFMIFLLFASCCATSRR